MTRAGRYLCGASVPLPHAALVRTCAARGAAARPCCPRRCARATSLLKNRTLPLPVLTARGSHPQPHLRVGTRGRRATLRSRGPRPAARTRAGRSRCAGGPRSRSGRSGRKIGAAPPLVAVGPMTGAARRHDYMPLHGSLPSITCVVTCTLHT